MAIVAAAANFRAREAQLAGKVATTARLDRSSVWFDGPSRPTHVESIACCATENFKTGIVNISVGDDTHISTGIHRKVTPEAEFFLPFFSSSPSVYFTCIPSSILLSIHLSVPLSISPFIPLSIPLSIRLFIPLSIRLSISLYIPLSIPLSISLYIHLSISLSISLLPCFPIARSF